MLRPGAVAPRPQPQLRGNLLLLLAACRSEQGILDAVLSSDDYGSSVKRTAKLHPLWRGLGVYQALDAVHLWRTWGSPLGYGGCRLWVDVAAARWR